MMSSLNHYDQIEIIVNKPIKLGITELDKDTWKKVTNIKFTNPEKVEVVQEYLYPPKTRMDFIR